MVWEDSEICTWLNGDFYKRAFDETEKGKIKPVGIVFNDDGSDYYDFDSDKYNVFLLSKAEAKDTEDEVRKCLATSYANKHGAYDPPDNDYCVWWLRSPSNRYHSNNWVYFVNLAGVIKDDLVSRDYFVVRPALWINLN